MTTLVEDTSAAADAAQELQPVLAETPPPAETTGEQPPAEPTRLEKLRTLLDEIDPSELDEVARHTKVAGKVGNLAQQRAEALATERADQIVAERAAAADAERRRQLRTSDPWQYAQEDAAREQTEAEKKLAAQRETQAGTHVAAAIVSTLEATFTKSFPPEVLQKTAGKTYEGTFEQGVAARVADLIESSKATLRAEWEREALPALRKQWLAETNGEEPSPALGGGSAAPGSLAFGSEAQAAQAFMDGRITIDQMRQWKANQARRR